MNDRYPLTCRIWQIILTICLIPVLGWGLPVQWVQNYAPVVIENSSTLPANQVYFVSHALDNMGVPCFLVPDPTTGICSYVYPDASGNNNSVQSSRTLSQLPTATGSAATNPAYLIYMPINISGRGYLSLNQPLFIETSSDPQTGFIQISDPALSALNDPNFYTLYQDFEFTFTEGHADSSTSLFLNVSYVDHFTLPMQLAAYQLGNPTPLVYGCSDFSIVTVPAGTISTYNRGTLITNMLAAMNTGPWANLGLAYYANPYTGTTPTSYLRILAAKNSIGFGTGGSQFVGAETPQQYFPADYISNPTYGPAPTDFIGELYSFYQSTSNVLDAVVTPAAGNLTYSISATSSQPNVLLFNTSSIANQNMALDLTTLTTEQLLSGGAMDFTAQAGSSAPDAGTTAELQKLLSGLFAIGKLPISNSQLSSAPFNNTQQGFAAQNFKYFVNPYSGMTQIGGGPWWNVYDLAVHTYEITNSTFKVPQSNTDISLGNGYAYDFDDLLNMSGLIGGLIIQDQYGNNPTDLICAPCNAQAAVPCGSTQTSTPQGVPTGYALMTLENVSGMPIPDISQDAYSYVVAVGSRSGVTTVQFNWYDNMGMMHSAMAPTSGTLTLTPQPDINPALGRKLTATFTYGGIDYVYNINLLRQMVTPLTSNSISNAFTGVTRKYQAGILFGITNLNPQQKVPTGQDPQFLLTFDTSAPPWNQ